MTGSASNAGAEDGSSESSFALDEPLRSTSVLPTKQPHAAPPAPGAPEGVPRGGAANGGVAGCGAAGAEGAEGDDEAQGAERFPGASDSDPASRDGLDTAQSDDAPRPVAGHNVAVCPASRATAFEVVQKYLLSVWTTLSSEYNLHFSIPDDAAINKALRDADWDPMAVCEAFGKRIFAMSFDLDGEGGERFGGHERWEREAGRTAVNDTASQTSSADAPSEREAGANVSSPFGERRPFGTSSNIQTEEARTPRKGAASPTKPAAKSSPFCGPPVPPLHATPSKHIPPTVRAEFPDLAERSYAELSEIRAKAGWPTVSRTRKAPPSAKPARRPLFPHGRRGGASFAQLEAPPSPASSEATPSDGLIVPAVLTDVPDDWENGDHCPIVQRLHKGQLAFFDRVKHVRNRHGLHPFWNLVKLPFSRRAGCKTRLTAQVIHYQTSEMARGLKRLHSAAARRSNGDLREPTWRCEEEAVGRENMEQMAQLDMHPFSFGAYTDPSSELAPAVLDFVMREWDEKVLSVLHREDVTIALCSKATALLWAEYRLGGNLETLEAAYELEPDKYVSASAEGFLAPPHAAALYKPEFWSNMETKCSEKDFFCSALLQLVTNDPSAQCTYFSGFFNDNSPFLRLCQQAFLEGCRHGGDTMGKRRTRASELWESDEDLSPEHWEALLACSRGGETMGTRRTEAKALYDAGLDMLEEHVEALLACSSGGETMGARRTEAARLNNAGLDMAEEHYEALLACSHGAEARWGGPTGMKKRLEEYLDVLAKCTSASERVVLFELKSAGRLNKFIIANELDLAQSEPGRFKRLKEIYLQKHADDDKLTVALAHEDAQLQKHAKEAKSKQRVRERAAQKERAAEVQKAKEERNARMRALFATSNDSPSLFRGRGQPIEVVSRWLSSRKPEWRSSRRKRSLDTSEKAEEEKEERAAKKRRKAEEIEAEKQRKAAEKEERRAKEAAEKAEKQWREAAEKQRKEEREDAKRKAKAEREIRLYGTAEQREARKATALAYLKKMEEAKPQAKEKREAKRETKAEREDDDAAQQLANTQSAQASFGARRPALESQLWRVRGALNKLASKLPADGSVPAGLAQEYQSFVRLCGKGDEAAAQQLSTAQRVQADFGEYGADNRSNHHSASNDTIAETNRLLEHYASTAVEVGVPGQNKEQWRMNHRNKSAEERREREAAEKAEHVIRERAVETEKVARLKALILKASDSLCTTNVEDHHVLLTDVMQCHGFTNDEMQNEVLRKSVLDVAAKKKGKK